MDGNDAPMIGMGWVFILTPLCTILGAALLGGVQLLVYRLLQRLGRIGEDGIPIFPVLLFRGMLGMLALIATGAILIKSSGVKFWEDPMLSDEAREGYREVLDPELREQRRREGETGPEGTPTPAE